MKRLTVIGNLGRDPELKADANGNQFATFSVAVGVGTKAAPRTDWVEVSCSARLAEVAMLYAKKGHKVLVEGFPSATAYINSDGEAVAVQRLYARILQILTRAEKNQALESEGLHEDISATEIKNPPETK